MLIGSVQATLLVLLVVIVFGPILAERFRIPGLIGLIAGGMITGSFALGWLNSEGLVSDLGAVGILYLMFVAGLGFNLRAFIRNRNNAVVYGLLGFAVPFAISIFGALSLLDISVLGAALVGAMWASNTLIAYPEVRAAGLHENRAVSAAVSAGVVADLLSLLVLAVATSTAVIEIDQPGAVDATVDNPSLPLVVAIPLLLGFTLWLLPKIAEWFFVNVGRTRMQRFGFTLAGMAAGAVIAMMGGIEGLIGAFLAGLGLNRLVPARSALMERIDFVGSAIFIPAFLVSIGVVINPRVLVDLDTIRLALVFTAFVVIGKSIAAAVTGLLFRLSLAEVGLMSSLSFGQAASTLAIAQVGFSLGMFGIDVVNASVLTIVFTALITSFATRFFIGRVPRPVSPHTEIGEMVLVDTQGSASDLEATMSFSGAIARPDDGVVSPYAVPGPGEKAAARARVERAREAASVAGLDTVGHVRVDESFVSGTLSLIDELDATMVILSWEGPRFTADYMIGTDIDRIGAESPVPCIAARIIDDWTRIVVVTGDLDRDWHREDALLALELAHRLDRARHVPVTVYSRDPDGFRAIADYLENFTFAPRPERDAVLLDGIGPEDLVIVPSHMLLQLTPLQTWRAAKALPNTNVAVVAGPHRLRVTKGVMPQTQQSVVRSPA